MDVEKKNFPAGMRVLVVDDDRICLMVIEKVLQKCEYDVMAVLQAEVALEMLRAGKGGADQFDSVITDVHMPGMDGFKLLQLIILEMNIPVIMSSADDRMKPMLNGVKNGACEYMVKPVRIEQVKSLWTHVVRKKGLQCISSGNDDAVQKLLPGNADGENECAKKTRKYSTQKQERVNWSGPLHGRFVEVVHHIGLDIAVPKQVLRMMNVNGLSRESVASHHQKYRLRLKKLSAGTYKLSHPFSDQPRWNEWNPIELNGPENCIPNTKICQGGSLLKDAAVPGSEQEANPFIITFRKSHVNIQPQVRSNGLSSYESILRQTFLGASRGIPVDDDDAFQSIGDGDMLASNSLLPAQSQLVNQRFQMQPSPADPFNGIATEPPRFAKLSITTNTGNTADVPPKFDDLGYKDGPFEGPSQGNNFTVNKFLGHAAASVQMPNSGNEFQNQMDIIMSEETIPMGDFNYQMAPVNLGSNKNSIVMPNDNCALGSASIMIYTLPNGEGVCGNLPMNDNTVGLQAGADELRNRNGSIVGASEAHGMSGDLVDDFCLEDFFIDDAYIDGSLNFDPSAPSL